MKLSLAIVPWYNAFLLNKAIALIKPGMEELTAAYPTEGEYFNVYVSLQAGSRELVIMFADEQETSPEKEQFVALQKLMDSPKDFAGFYITELCNSGIHLFAAWIAPQYRTGELIQQGFSNLMKKVELANAPYLTTCTREKGLVEKLGFTEVYTKYQIKFKK
jgi:hypothetical protein